MRGSYGVALALPGEHPKKVGGSVVYLVTSSLPLSLLGRGVPAFYSLAHTQTHTLSLSIYLSFYLSIFLSFYLSIFLSFYLSIFPSFYLSIFLSFYLSIFLSFYLSICLSIYLSMYLQKEISFSWQFPWQGLASVEGACRSQCYRSRLLVKKTPCDVGIHQLEGG